MGTINERPKALYVKLKAGEMLNAAIVGAQRNIVNIKAGRPGVYGIPNGYDWQAHIDGAIAEYIVAKSLGVFWNSGVRVLGAPDVDTGVGVEVRSTHSRKNRLVIHPDDHDERAYVLVTGHSGEYWIEGWMFAADCKLDKYWKDPTGKQRHAYFVPIEDLLEFDNLLMMMNM